MKLKYLSHSANDLYWFILPLILPALLVKFDLTYGGGGGILTLYLAVTAVGSFVMGRISDRIARREIIGFGFLLASAGLITAGFINTLPLFLLVIALSAVGVSTFHPVMYALIDETVTTGKGKILGIYEVFGTLAILLMFLVNGFLISRLGTRGVLILTALPGLLMGVVFLKSRTIHPPTPQMSAERAKTQSGRSGKSFVMLIVFLVSVMLRVLSVTAVVNFLPTIFVDYFHFKVDTAAYATAFFFAGGIAGSLTAARIADILNHYIVLIIASVLIAGSIFLLRVPMPLLFYPLVVFFLGMFGSGCIINQNLLLSRLGAGLGRGELFGILMGVMTMTSSIAPGIFGIIADKAGFTRALSLASIPVLFSFAILMVLFRRDRV